MFRIDPISVLNADNLEWLARLACFNIVAEEMKKEYEKSKRGR